MKNKLVLTLSILTLLVPVALSSCNNPLTPDIKKTKSHISVDSSGDKPVITVTEDYKTPEKLTETIIAKGDGDPVTDKNSITINYILTSKTGEIIYNTYDYLADQPTYVVSIENSSSLLKGVKQALDGKPVGTKMIVEIPSDLAYGELGYHKFDTINYDNVEIVAPGDPVIAYIEVVAIG
jgi:hypothetical protein